MKKKFPLLFILALSFVSIKCSMQKTQSTNHSSIKFLEDTYVFGDIPINKPATHNFWFVNSGSTPLFIMSASTSCSCDVAVASSENEIMPNDSGWIHYTYNAPNYGAFNKTITVTTNSSPSVITLWAKGFVK